MTTNTLSLNRIITVDVLRGMALFGILYAHMIFWYTAGPLPEKLYSEQDIFSNICMGFLGLLFSGKFFSFFSFLFGLSFYLQMKSFESREDNFILRYGWRLLILGIIGLIHHALWRGDILSIYVPLGFVLIFTRKWNDKVILVLGLVLALNVPNKIYEAVTLTTHTKAVDDPEVMKKEAAIYYEVVKNGSLMEVIKSNWEGLGYKFNYQITGGRLFITFGFFLLGMYTGRQRWFQRLDEVKPLIKKIWKTLSLTLIGAVVIAIAVGGTSLALQLKFEEHPWLVWGMSLILEVFNSGLTLFYISGITLLLYKSWWQKALHPLAPIGKMALTSYLTQTVFGLILFYHFGLGLFEKTSPAINTLIGIGVFICQIFISKWWLSKFAYGPMEWLWRSLTFLKIQSIKRKPDQQLTPATVVAE